MPAESDFTAVFEALVALLRPYASQFVLQKDTATEYYLDCQKVDRKKQRQFFASAAIMKNYVSFYLMPVYCYPDLLHDVSPRLRGRMQGKACFNFTAESPELFDELAQLVKQCVARLREEGAM